MKTSTPAAEVTYPTTVVGYIRGSTDDQQNTLEAQENQIRAYCDYRKFHLAKCYVDRGESAFSSTFAERPQAAELLQNVRELGASGIVFAKLDRGFRDALDCLFTVHNLGTRGIEMHILDIQLDTSTPVGKLVLTVMAAIAEFENKRRSERQLAAFKVMRAQGQRCGNIPYGWDAIPVARISKTGRPADNLVPNESEQRTLHRLIEGDLSTMTDNAAARVLNSEGIPAKKGGRWFGATIENLRKRSSSG